MITKLNLKALRQRSSPIPPANRETDFDPMRKRTIALQEGAPRKEAKYVLYWMQIHRRAYHNQALNFAIEQANALRLPLVVYEGLRPDYDQANDRIHRFILEGALNNQREFAQRRVRYCFYLMPDAQTGNRRAVAQLAQEAALLVTDDFPAFIIPQHNRAIVKQVDCPVYAIDTNSVVPIRESDHEEYAARTIRPRIHRLLPAYFWPIAEVAPKIKSSDLPLNLGRKHNSRAPTCKPYWLRQKSTTTSRLRGIFTADAKLRWRDLKLFLKSV